MTIEDTKLPAPLVGPEVDLRAFEFMPLHITKLARSTTWNTLCRARPELGYYIMNLWCAAWHEVPAGSLPGDDKTLCGLAICAPQKWKFVKDQVLRGWARCSDGRIYHRPLADLAIAQWTRRISFKDRTEAARKAAAEKAKLLKNQREAASVTDPVTSPVTEPVTDPVTEPVTARKGEGEGEGDIRTPLPPAGGNGAHAPAASRRSPQRQVKDQSRGAYMRVVMATTAVRRDNRTWADVATITADDPAISQALSILGAGEFGPGCRLVADADKFTRSDIEERFRAAYETAQQSAVPP